MGEPSRLISVRSITSSSELGPGGPPLGCPRALLPSLVDDDDAFDTAVVVFVVLAFFRGEGEGLGLFPDFRGVVDLPLPCWKFDESFVTDWACDEDGVDDDDGGGIKSENLGVESFIDEGCRRACVGVLLADATEAEADGAGDIGCSEDSRFLFTDDLDLAVIVEASRFTLEGPARGWDCVPGGMIPCACRMAVRTLRRGRTVSYKR